MGTSDEPLSHPLRSASAFFVAGILAGASTAALSCPLELIRNQRILHDAQVEAYQRRLVELSTTTTAAVSSPPSKTSTVAPARSLSSFSLKSPSALQTPLEVPVVPSLRKTTSFEYARVLVLNNGLFKGLYRGFHLHLLRESLGTGIYWVSYELLHFLPWISPSGRREDASGAGHFVAGGLTGMISWLFIFPIDLVKNVYQKEANLGKSLGPAKILPYRGALDCVQWIYRQRGWRGFYHGLWPTMWRAFPIHAINLLVYEYFLSVLSVRQT